MGAMELAAWVTIGAVGALGLTIIIVAVSIMTWREFQVRRGVRGAAKRGHDTRDVTCMFWWGDRHGSLAAICPICNPVRENSHG